MIQRRDTTRGAGRVRSLGKPLFAVPLVILAGAIGPASAASTAPVAALERQGFDDSVTVALLVGSANTRQAVSSASEDLRRAYQQVDLERERTWIALRRTDVSEKARVQLEARNRGLLTRQAALMQIIASQNVEFAAYLRSFREGFTGLEQDNDPRIRGALQRYAQGDSAALDDLQEIVLIDQNASLAGWRARAAAKQRGVAYAWDAALDVGDRTTEQVLDAWTRAADLDADNFGQWVAIAQLQHNLDRPREAEAAARKAARYAANDQQRVGVYHLFERLRLGPAPGLGKGETNRTASIRIYQSLAAAEPENGIWLVNLVYQLGGVGYEALQTKDTAAAETAIRQANDLVERLVKANPKNAVVLASASEAQARLGDLLVAQQRWVDAETAYDRSLGYARDVYRQTPNNIDNARLLVNRLDKMGDWYMGYGRWDLALPVFREQVALAGLIASRDPKNADLASLAWFAHTGLGLAAMRSGAFDIARDSFLLAMKLGDPFAGSDRLSFMVHLTWSRLAAAEAALGNLPGARQAIDRGFAIDVTREKDIASLELDRAANLAEFAFTARDYVQARTQYGAIVDTAIAKAKKGGADSSDAFETWFVGMAKLAQIDVEQGRLADASARFARLAASATGQGELSPPPARALEIEMVTRFYSADLPDSSGQWPRIAEVTRIMAKDKNHSASQVDALVYVAGFADKRVAQSAGPRDTNMTGVQAYLGSLRRGLALIEQDVAADPKQLSPQLMRAFYLRLLASTPGSGVPWSRVRDCYRDMVKGGFALEPMEAGNFQFAAARAAIDGAAR